MNKRVHCESCCDEHKELIAALKPAVRPINLPSDTMSKESGTHAELAFALECIKRGWIVAAPLGDYAPYDYLVENEGKVLRVQVKSGVSIDKVCRFASNSLGMMNQAPMSLFLAARKSKFIFLGLYGKFASFKDNFNGLWSC